MTTRLYVDPLGDVRCTCGNRPDLTGLLPCDATGAVQPDETADFKHLVCPDCGAYAAYDGEDVTP